MILGLEIGLIIFGLIALIRGKITIAKTKVVEGVAARLLGLLALTPLPLAFLVVMLYVLASAPKDPEKFTDDNKLTIALIEAAIVIGVAAMVFIIGAVIGKPPEKKRTRRDEDDEDDEDDHPRRRSRAEHDDDDEDDRPRRRRARADDDDDDDERDRRRNR